MKLCRTCGEEFSDKFVFCPVDGSSLDAAAAAPVVEPSVVTEAAPALEEYAAVRSSAASDAGPSAPSNGSGETTALPPSNGSGRVDPEVTVPSSRALVPREEYHLTMLQDAGVVSRLSKELREVGHEYELTWPEFKKDPAGFSKRMAVGYGTMLQRFFKQPYVAASVLAGVIGMTLVVTSIVFPYKDVYKFFASDGRLVADMGMPFEEVQRRSTLKLTAQAATPDSAQPDAPPVTTVSGENLAFDFELPNKGLKFEWARSYLLTLDAEQKVKEINVELTGKPQTWKELSQVVRSLDESLDEKGWRVFNDADPDGDEMRVLKASLTDARPAPPAEGDPGELKWINRDGDTVVTLSAKRAGGDPSADGFVSYLKVEALTRESLIAMIEVPEEQEKPDEGPAGNAKGTGGGMKPKQEKPGGGGGGGRREQLPASVGKLPQGALQPQIVAVTPHPPAIKNPNLPVTPHVIADPVLFPIDNRPIAFGDPKSTSTTPSAGPGDGAGIGTGSGTGVGSGEGAGVGPGRGFNTGGGDPNIGGGGPGGGGGGTDYNRTFNAKDVTRKAQLLNKPEPGFTEEARKNNVTGTVKLRLVLGASGAVSNISVVKGLPDGLTERAIAAARRIQFVPAQKDGRNVSQWVTIEYNFNIY